MLGHNPNTVYQITNYYNDKVQVRKNHVHKSVYRIAKVVQDVLKDVESQEPRFISTLVETNGRYDGVSLFGTLMLQLRTSPCSCHN